MVMIRYVFLTFDSTIVPLRPVSEAQVAICHKFIHTISVVLHVHTLGLEESTLFYSILSYSTLVLMKPGFTDESWCSIAVQSALI